MSQHRVSPSGTPLWSFPLIGLLGLAGLGGCYQGEWRLGVGTVRALRGEMRSPSVELSWTKAFGLSSR